MDKCPLSLPQNNALILWLYYYLGTWQSCMDTQQSSQIRIEKNSASGSQKDKGKAKA